MDLQPTTTKPISDDQELAKVLAGVTQEADTNEAALHFEETPLPTPTAPAPVDPVPVAPVAPVADEPETPESEPSAPTPDEPTTPVFSTPTFAPTTPDSDSSDDLASIKKDALGELRPLVDKLQLEPEEKFDTYLLLLRSTDDKTLIPQAYAAAQSIADETRKAQALLDIIKEIDFLSSPQA